MKNNIMLNPPNPQENLICSICQKEFKFKEKYVIAGGYACSWKCFLREVKRQEKEKEITGVKNNKRQKK